MTLGKLNKPPFLAYKLALSTTVTPLATKEVPAFSTVKEVPGLAVKSPLIVDVPTVRVNEPLATIFS